MVATAGAGWRLAPSLVALVEETDKLYPKRDHASDGSIASSAHTSQNPTSDHEPDDGWVCAVDLDEDLSPTLHTIERLWDHLIADRDHRVKYLIYEDRIVKSYLDGRGVPPWVEQAYTGANEHLHHLHVSVWNTPIARNDTGPWWPPLVVPKPPALILPKERTVFIASNKTATWLFEPGRRTLVPTGDKDNLKAAGIPNLGVVSDGFFEDLAKGRERFQ